MTKIEVPKTHLWTETEVADYLKVSVSALRKWRTQGCGPRFLKLNGTSVKYRPEDIEAWLESCPTGGQAVAEKERII